MCTLTNAMLRERRISLTRDEMFISMDETDVKRLIREVIYPTCVCVGKFTTQTEKKRTGNGNLQLPIQVSFNCILKGPMCSFGKGRWNEG